MFALNNPPPMPPGQTDQVAWDDAYKNGWIVDASVPLTQIDYKYTETITPPCDNTNTYTFPLAMRACPLTLNGPPGSAPDSKATWWSNCFSTKAANWHKRAWVQGHLLNHHIHGPGVPKNLVPITDELNRIMEKWAEKVIKDEVLKKKLILDYRVTVLWLAGSKVGSYHPVGSGQRHADDICKNLDNHKKGECMAPTALKWEAEVIAWDAGNNAWKQQAVVNFKGYEGIENGIFPNSWFG